MAYNLRNRNPNIPMSTDDTKLNTDAETNASAPSDNQINTNNASNLNDSPTAPNTEADNAIGVSNSPIIQNLNTPNIKDTSEVSQMNLLINEVLKSIKDIKQDIVGLKATPNTNSKSNNNVDNIIATDNNEGYKPHINSPTMSNINLGNITSSKPPNKSNIKSTEISYTNSSSHQNRSGMNSLILKIPLPKFNGKSGDEYNVFMNKFIGYSRNYQLDDINMIQTLVQCLEGDAGIWLNNQINSYGDDIFEWEWIKFEQLLNGRFKNEAARINSMTQYMNRRFKFGENVKDLADDLDQLAIQSGKSYTLTEDLRKEKLYSCLSDSIKYELMKKGLDTIKTYQDMLAAAINLETILRLQSQRKSNYQNKQQKGSIANITNDNTTKSNSNYHSTRNGNKGNNPKSWSNDNNKSSYYKGNPPLCYVCGSDKHKSYQCPNRYDNRSKTPNPPINPIATDNNAEGHPQDHDSIESNPKPNKEESNNTHDSNKPDGNTNKNKGQSCHIYMTPKSINSVNTIAGAINGHRINKMLIDSGSTHSLISHRLFQTLINDNNVNIESGNNLSTQLITASSSLPTLSQASTDSECLKVIGVIELPLALKTINLGTANFVIVEQLNSDTPVYIGNDILQHFNISLLNETNSLGQQNTSLLVKQQLARVDTTTLKVNGIKLLCDKFNGNTQINSVATQNKIESSESKSNNEIILNTILPEHMNSIQLGSELSQNQKEILLNLLSQYSDCFAKPNEIALIKTDIKHKINTGDTPPKRQRPYRQPQHILESIDTTINQLLTQNIIKECDSEWASPVTCVPKKDGSLRMCGDYRYINSATKMDAFPIPNIEDMKEYFTGATIFTGIDLKDAYLGIEIAEEDQDKTAIITRKGLYKYTRMAFGLKNAPATFNRLMNKIFKDYNGKFVTVYFDDINAYDKTFNEHIIHLKLLLDRMRQYNLKAKPSKCKFGVKDLNWMGYIVSADGIKPDPRLVNKITNMPTPTNLNELRQILGLTNYYRQFIPNYAKISTPLYQLTKKNIKYIWNDPQQQSFDILKQKLISYPILRPPDFNNPFILYTDASDYAIGAVLGQLDIKDNNKEYVVGYYSRMLNKAECKLSVTDKECKALVSAIKHFYPYVGYKQITVYVDHISLIYLQNIKEMHGTLGRMSLYLQQFDLILKYKPGKIHNNADALSRISEQGIINNLTDINNTDNTPQIEPANKIPLEIKEPEFLNELQLNNNKNLINFKIIKEEQEKDPVLHTVSELIKNDMAEESELTLRQSHGYKTVEKAKDLIQSFKDDEYEIIIKDGLLYNYNHIDYRLIIPSNELLRITILKQFHNEMGHSGEIKTLTLMRPRVWWSTMLKDIKEWIKSCEVCSKSKGRSNKNEISAKYNIISHDKIDLTDETKLPESFSTLVVDHTDIDSNGRYKYLLCIIDRTTRWAEAYPCKTKNSEEYLTILRNQWIPHYGIPKYILSDHGGAFESKIVDEFYQTYGIESIYSTSYNPQSHGLIEIFNKTLKGILRSLNIEQRDNDEHIIPWIDLLPQAMFYYRVTIHHTLKVSPYEMVFSHKPKLSGIDNLRNSEYIYSSASNYLAKHIDRLNASYKIVYQNLMKIKSDNMQFNKENANRIVIYNIGDKVWLREELDTKKVYAKWKGPYIVKSIIGEATYEIRLLNKRGKSRLVNARRLKKVYDDGYLSSRLRNMDNSVRELIGTTEGQVQE
jgi:hypothetical protein